MLSLQIAGMGSRKFIEDRMLQEDFSENARTENFDKYSRFFGKSEFSDWCNEPTLRYTEGFRDLIYQINPHYISCVYKKMFDACATNQLRIVDDDGVVDDERESTTGVVGTGLTPENLTPRGYGSETVDRSNSCIYSQTAGLGSLNCTKNATNKTKDLIGWFICERPHSASCTMYQKAPAPEPRGPETRDTTRRALYNRVLSPGTFQDNLRNARQSPAKMKRQPFRHGSANVSEVSHRLPLREVSEENSGRQCGGSASCISAINSPIKVGKNFKHFKRSASYMDQYREEYTYRKLYEIVEKNGIILPEPRDCPCGNQSCTGCHSSASSKCPERWYPHQSQAAEKCQSAPPPPGIHAPKWPNPLKTRSQSSTIPKPARVPVHVLIPQLEGAQRSDRAPWSKELKQKMGFFATSLTINNYNPTKPPSPCPHMRSGSSSITSVITSKSGASVKGQRSCSSTTPVPDRHGNQNLKGAV